MSVDLAKLKFLVGHSPYSYHQIHKAAKLPRSAYRYWNGERPFPLEIALRISHYAGIPANEFLDTDTLWLINCTVKRNDEQR